MTSNIKNLGIIADAIEDVTGTTLAQLRSINKHRPLAEARQILCFFARKIHPKTTVIALGEYLERNHSTVVHYAESHRDLYRLDKAYKTKVDKVEVRINELLNGTTIDECAMYAIYNPDGELSPATLSQNSVKAWLRSCVKPSDIPEYERHGFTCRPVKVTIKSTKP